MATVERPKSRSRRRQSLFEPRDTGFSDGGYNSDSGGSTADKLQQGILRLQNEINQSFECSEGAGKAASNPPSP